MRMNRDELDAHYRRYIAALNERRLDEAETFYADTLLYNGARISRAEWRRTAIDDSFDAMPDLQWHVEQITIEGGMVAARLRDTGTLRQSFHGIQPTGRPASFGEHVFYRFRNDGRTDEVWSVFDVLALQDS